MLRNRTGDSAAVRATRLWLLALTLAFLAFGIYAGRWFSRPTVAIVALIIFIMWPFALARLWLMRTLQRLDRKPWRLTALCAIVFACLDAIMVGQLITARADFSLSMLTDEVIGWVGPVWFSAHAMIFAALATLRPLRRLQRWLFPPLPDSVSQERRDLLRNLGRAGVGVPFAVSLSGVETSYDFEVNEHEIELASWPRELDGLRIAHLSDIHVGGSMDEHKLRRVVDLTNAARPDIVLHTGDFLTHRIPGFDEPLYPALAKIEAQHGQLACFGNHDFDDPQRLVRRLNEAGVQVLRNRLIQLEVLGQPIEIGGVDFTSFGPDRERLYAAAMRHWPKRSTLPRVLLCHDPTAFSILPAHCADLVLSGHTHGGHIGIQLDKDTALTVVGIAGFPDQGIYLRDDMKMFVTRCVGFYGYPIRLGIRPEIALLTLRSPAGTS